jgi:hypothetical protein
MNSRCLVMSAAVIAAGLLGGGCMGKSWGLPRIAVEATSPDGRCRAFVRNHPSLDPPLQSLWIDIPERGTTQVMQLSEDQDWCNLIAWAPDSRTVAFLLQDARLVVVDAVTGSVRLDRWLVDRDGYPPSHTVKNVRLAPDGSSARFTDCTNRTGECVEREEGLR